MLPFLEWRHLVEGWYKTKQFKLMHLSSRKRLEAKGYIRLPSGSYYLWMKKEDFDEAINTGALVKNYYEQYLPTMIVLETEDEKNKKKKILEPTLAFKQFSEKYEKMYS